MRGTTPAGCSCMSKCCTGPQPGQARLTLHLQSFTCLRLAIAACTRSGSSAAEVFVLGECCVCPPPPPPPPQQACLRWLEVLSPFVLHTCCLCASAQCFGHHALPNAVPCVSPCSSLPAAQVPEHCDHSGLHLRRQERAAQQRGAVRGGVPAQLLHLAGADVVGCCWLRHLWLV